jgi:hypothetical protein
MRLVSPWLALAAATTTAAVAQPARAQSTASAAPAAEPEAADYPPPSTRWKVAGVGLVAAGVFYGAGAGLSYVYPDVPGMTDLRKPVIGPWLGVAHSGCGSDPDCSTVLVVVRTVLMALDGAAQAGSLAVMLEGLFMPTQEATSRPASEVPAAPTPPPTKPAPGGGDKNLFLVPMPMTVGQGGIGAGIVGRF